MEQWEDCIITNTGFANLASKPPDVDAALFQETALIFGKVLVQQVQAALAR
jgi:hypothetical protein